MEIDRKAPRPVAVTIAVSASRSARVEMPPYHHGIMLEIPSGTEGAQLQFRVSATADGTLRPLLASDGTRFRLPFTADSAVALHPAALAGARSLDVETVDGSGVAVNQVGADAVLNLVVGG